MSFRLFVYPRAEHELATIADWYNLQRSDLGREFLLTFDQELARIVCSPLMFAKVFRELRQVTMARFPYAIFYRINDDVVEVLAVVHTSQDPGQWQSLG